ncbi:hypothetical protein [Roseivirga sp.]|uniref:hypothetical protein n=1 Tax=Roseivirga sp. TaxID=1964215 RepID=UPI003B520F9B
MTKFYLFSSKSERKLVVGPDGIYLKTGVVPMNQLKLFRLYNAQLEGYILKSDSFFYHFAKTEELNQILAEAGVEQIDVELEEQVDYTMDKSSFKARISELNFKQGGQLKISLGDSLCLGLSFIDESSDNSFRSSIYCGKLKVGQKIYEYGDEKTYYFFHELLAEPVERKIESEGKGGKPPVWLEAMRNAQASEEAIYSGVWKLIVLAFVVVAIILMFIL